MLRVVVRSKKDRDAVAAALKTFYPGWSIELLTLGGVRDPGKAYEKILSLTGDVLTLVLVGREDSGFLVYEKEAPANVVYYMLKYKKVRNARTIAIARAIERAKAKFRLDASWSEKHATYLYDHRLRRLVREDEPAYDFFPVFGRGLSFLEMLGLKVRQPLLLRMMGGKHVVYDCGVYTSTLIFGDKGKPVVDEVAGTIVEDRCERKGLREMALANKERLLLLERLALSFLKKLDEKIDVKRIVVPLSGGKDSAAVLYLAHKLWDSSVEAVYVDTGVDFPENAEAVEALAEKMNVDVTRVEAPIRESLGKMGLPTHENRWCTGLKIAALHGYLKRSGAGRDTLVVVGDRDAESRSRARRPPLRFEEGWLVAAPIRLWGSHHVELFLELKGILFNPLYELGFYRTGCYICPSLRSWELYVMEKSGILGKLERMNRDIVERFLSKKEWG